MKKSVLLLVCSLLLISCSPSDYLTGGSVVDTQRELNPAFYKYHPFVDECDRFRLIFEQELAQYPALNQMMDLPTIYALAYQESLCKTRKELKIEFDKNNDTRETWQGGIMQVDGCWRSNLDCSTVRQEISEGVGQLAFLYSIINKKIERLNLNISKEQRVEILLLGYNRGYGVATSALELLSTNNFKLEGVTRVTNEKVEVFVNCPEKDRCSNDLEFIDVTNELSGFEDGFERAMLLACRSKFGYMKDSQGDYCTGKDYGLNYPKASFELYEQIVNNSITPFKEKEFYIDEITFSDYDWRVKTSVGKMGPGPNHFYLNDNSVFVDEQGLHLRLLEEDGKWYSSEVVLSESLGYGTYTFEVKESALELHENVVFGLFTYDLTFSNDPTYFHRELDAEFSRWTNKEGENVHFTVQGPSLIEPTEEFFVDHKGDLTVRIIWQENFASFELLNERGELLESLAYSGKLVPKPDQERVRMNLWLFKESEDLTEQEVVIKGFRYSEEVDLGVFSEGYRK